MLRPGVCQSTAASTWIYSMYCNVHRFNVPMTMTGIHPMRCHEQQRKTKHDDNANRLILLILSLSLSLSHPQNDKLIIPE